MAYTKKIAKFDKILIDDVDVSNSFSEFGYSSEKERVDVSGFSSSGTDEFLPGSTTQGFSGTAFYTEELAAIVEPLHRNNTLATISWQPDGLADATREIYYGECYINTFEAPNEVGAVAVTPFAATPGPGETITTSNWT